MFLRGVTAADPAELHGRRVTLRVPTQADHAEWAALREASRGFLVPWEPVWPADDLTRAAFRRRVKRYQEEVRQDRAYSFLIFRRDEGRSEGHLVGGISLSGITRGMTQSATIGYWMGAAFANQGYMTASLAVLIDHAFGTLRLHRLEAACLPDNLPSRRLLERAGFRQEGLARGLVCIAGAWRDHLVFARLSSDR